VARLRSEAELANLARPLLSRVPWSGAGLAAAGAAGIWAGLFAATSGLIPHSWRLVIVLTAGGSGIALLGMGLSSAEATVARRRPAPNPDYDRRLRSRRRTAWALWGLGIAIYALGGLMGASGRLAAEIPLVVVALLLIWLGIGLYASAGSPRSGSSGPARAGASRTR
jgi:hypothetical protein